ncbi:MAG TPA: hypothetical protein VF192_10450 [Longimicrobiales bacterium]
MSRARPHRLARSASLIALAVLTLSACSNKQRLGEYDFRGRTLAVVTIAPPHPDVFSGASLGRVDPDDAVGLLLRAGTEAVREVSAYRVREKLERAAREVDVSGRMSARVLENGARHLRARPVADPRPDYELEVRVRRYGIVAASWTEDAYFSIDAVVTLLDGATGRRIWRTDVYAHDPVLATVVGVGDRSVTNVLTAARLAALSEEEIRRAFESLADFAADAVVAELARALDDARG